MKLLRLIFLLIFLYPAVDGHAQIKGDSATAPGSSFKIGGSRHFWMGANYRKEWNTPITVPLINLSTEHGGLTPVKRGGGKQTKSLRFEDPTGRQYTLRSIQKFITSKTLPGDLQSDAAADLVADGVSASYPYAALSIPDLARAAGIPHGDVKVVYIPDDPKLGEYRAEFGNMLALYESRLPDSVSKGWDTDEVADKLKDDNDNDVDQLALLRIRILDMFVMDLDRHEDQWSWGAYDNGKGKTYYPIAKDRDQAFYTNQGLLPGIVKWPWLVPQLEGIKAEANNINRFNFAARNLDRFFLNELNEQDWKNAGDRFLSQMTDAVIEQALMRQPHEIRNMNYGKLTKILKDRRKYLGAELMQYYRFLSEIVSVTGSDKKELFDITRNADGSVAVVVSKITKEGEVSTKMYERTFDAKDTKEIRLYGFGGEDKFVVHGNVDKIKVRMIGGDGEDMFENTGTSGKGGIVYDMRSGNNKITGNFQNKMANDTVVNSYQRIYYKYNQVIPFVSLNYNTDDGLYLGASLKIIRHGFRKEPHKNIHEFAFNHAVGSSASKFRWYSEFMSVLGRNTDLLFETEINSPTITNFFGYGSNSIYDKTKPQKFKYYRARYQLGDISMMLRTRFSEKVWFALGPTYEYYSLDSTDSRNKTRNIVQNAIAGLDPNTVFADQSYFGGKLMFVVDTRDNRVMPRKGIMFASTLRTLSGLTDASYDVTQLNSEFSFYAKLNSKLVFANRMGFGHNFGDFEFFQAQYLGNESHLRGYRKNRFAGYSKVFNNAEIRWAVTKFRTYLFPGYLGLMAFYDVGRVWADVNDSKKLMAGYGAGLWVSPLSRIVITFTYAASKEEKMPLVSVGWRF
jgi:hypothetical protein